MKKVKAFLLVSLMGSSLAQAEVWAEREALSKVETELAAIEALVTSAEGRGNPEHRMTFDYTALISDLRKIRAGIRNHLSVPMEPIIPSTINALEGDYTEHKK